MYHKTLVVSDYELYAIQEEENVEENAQVIAKYLLETDVSEILEHSQRLEGFKIKMDETIPKEIADALRKSTRESNTLFKGAKLRIRVLPFSLLESTTVLKLKNLLENVDDWVQVMLGAKTDNFKEYGEEFYNFVDSNQISWKMVQHLPPDSGTGVYFSSTT